MRPPAKPHKIDVPSTELSDGPITSVSTSNSMATRRRVVAVLFLMLISVLLTSTLLVIGGVLVFRNVQARFWKRADGLLLDAHVDRHDQAKDQKPDIPVVKYAYYVDGKRLVSDKWSPAGYGLDIFASVEALKKQNPLTVYYNPNAPDDSAVVLPPVNIGFLPFVLGLGMFFILVVAMGGGALFAAIHPDIAASSDSGARKWITRTFRAGLALTLTSMTGLITLIAHSPGGWWQWALTLIAVVFAITRRL